MNRDWKTLLDSAHLLRPSRPNAPNVGRCQWDGRPALIKSYHHCSLLYRHTVGRLALNREWTALERLADSGRAPKPLARPTPWVVVMEWVDGTPLEQLERAQIPASHLVAQAEALLDCCHKAGIVHGDLGHDYWSNQGREANLMLTPDSRLVAIDFAGSWTLEGPWSRLAQALLLHDRLLITKVLYHWGDESLDQHPGWQIPSQRQLPWWELMRFLGKI